MKYYIKALKNYANFEGRARRKEYWLFILVSLLIVSVLIIIDTFIEEKFNLKVDILSTLYSLFILIPSLSVTTRRLHDIDKNGWWQLISIIPNILTNFLVMEKRIYTSSIIGLILTLIILLSSIIGLIWILLYMVREGQSGDNKYGEDPKKIVEA